MQLSKFSSVQRTLCLGIFVGFSLLSTTTTYADDLETKRIIEALKPDNTPKTRTRSLRNLQVEQAGNEAPPPQRFVSLTIGFKFNSAEITNESADTLNSLAKALKSDQLASLGFMIEGHTDGKGTPDYNMKLSQQRATAVKAYLEKQGIQGKQLQAQGKGDTELANADDRFAAENRRVKIITLNP